MLGTATALQPTLHHDEKMRIAAFVMLLFMRAAQLCLVDSDPLELSGLLATHGMFPFFVGACCTLGPEQLMRRLFRELSDARKVAKKASAEAAFERERAWELESARRALLVVQQRTRLDTSRNGRGSPAGLRQRAHAPDRLSSPQEEGYMSPVSDAGNVSD